MVYFTIGEEGFTFLKFIYSITAILNDNIQKYVIKNNFNNDYQNDP